MMFLNAQKPGLIRTAPSIKADSLMLDLRGRCGRKPERCCPFQPVSRSLKTVDYRGAERVVRINGLDTSLLAGRHPCLRGWRLRFHPHPKTSEHAEDVRRVAAAIAEDREDHGRP